MQLFETKQEPMYTDYEDVRDNYWHEIQDGGTLDDSAFQKIDQAMLTNLLTDSERLRKYFQRNIRYITSSIGTSHAAYLLFHENSGSIVDIVVTDPDLGKTLKSDGIKIGTIWTLDTIGPNAVTVGFRENSPMLSSGVNNYSQKLQKYSIAFSPLHMRNILPPYSSTGYGIVMLSLMAQEQMSLLAVASFTYGLKMTMHFNQTSWKYYSMSYSGYISYDAELQKDMVSIVHYDDMVVELLGAPKGNYAFTGLDALIDPPPVNKEFWNVVLAGTEIKDLNINLTCRGKTAPYIISTLNLTQPAIGSAGGLIKISTPQLESAKISNRIGNNALITFDQIIGNSPALERSINKAKLLAQSESNTMLLGESGTGKDMFAQAIHNAGSRKGKPFIAVNCGAIPRELVASELFGYAGGSFTGAKRQGNIGKFELANGGTIFLDEIGELPFDLQASLLRAVENKQIMRVGGSDLIDIDVKIISATNVDIPEMIRQHHFRADLYYRLSTTFISIPPLRERDGDIITLTEFFILKMSERTGKTYTMQLSEDAKQMLLTLPWHGNVRELQNLIENIVQLYPIRVIEPEHIKENISPHASLYENSPAFFPPNAAPQIPSANIPAANNFTDNYLAANTPAASTPLPKKVSKPAGFLTVEIIQEALAQSGGNRTAAAELLGVSRITLYRNMKRLGIY